MASQEGAAGQGGVSPSEDPAEQQQARALPAGPEAQGPSGAAREGWAQQLPSPELRSQSPLSGGAAGQGHGDARSTPSSHGSDHAASGQRSPPRDMGPPRGSAASGSSWRGDPGSPARNHAGSPAVRDVSAAGRVVDEDGRSLRSPHHSSLQDRFSCSGGSSELGMLPSPMNALPELRTCASSAAGALPSRPSNASAEDHGGGRGRAMRVQPRRPQQQTWDVRHSRASQDSLYELANEGRRSIDDTPGLTANEAFSLHGALPATNIHPLRRVSAAPADAQDIIAKTLNTTTRQSTLTFHSLPLLGWLGRWFLRREVDPLWKLAVLLSPGGLLSASLAGVLVVYHFSDLPAVVAIISCLVVVGAFSTVTALYVAQHTTRQQLTLAKELRRRFRVEKSVSRFVPAEFLEFLQYRDLTEVSVGHRITTNLAVLSSDIRDFTGLSQNMANVDAFDWLFRFTQRMNPAIREFKGFIDKYLGDGIVALFKVAENSVLASIRMQQEVEKLNAERVNEFNIRMGIGIHWGEVAVGTLGDADRIDAAIISGAVNIASRTEWLTKYYAARIIITHEVSSRSDLTDILHRSLGRIRVKGAGGTIGITDIFHADTGPRRIYKREIDQTWSSALAAYASRDWVQAERLLKHCAERAASCAPAAATSPTPVDDVHDHAALLKLHFIAKFSEEGMPFDDWAGEDTWMS